MKATTKISAVNALLFTVAVLLPHSVLAATHVATFIAHSAPAAMTPGQVYPVSVTMRNDGTDTWTEAALYRLGSQNPQDNSTWGLGRVHLPNSVAPGESGTFSFSITAPSTPGTYNFQWRMVHDLVAWFGDLTSNVAINVAVPQANFAECVVSAQGALECSSPTGGSCSDLGNGGKACRDRVGSATSSCTRTRWGTPTCTSSSAGCYVEAGVAKCYRKTPQGDSYSPPLFMSGGHTFQPQTVGTTSAVSSAQFMTHYHYPEALYNILGFKISGDFQIVGYSGTCSGQGTAATSCAVLITATPTRPGTRTGTVAMMTDRGTVVAALTVVGSGLPGTTLQDRNAGGSSTLRAVGYTAAAINTAVAAASSSVATKPRLKSNADVVVDVIGSRIPGGNLDLDIEGDGAFSFIAPFQLVGEPEVCPKAGSSSSSSLEFLLADTLQLELVVPVVDIARKMGPSETIPRARLATGNQTLPETDFAPSFAHPINVTRTYNSFGWSSASTVNVNLGLGWQLAWDRSISFDTSGSTAILTRGDGQAYTFTYSSGSPAKWSSTADLAATLTPTNDAQGKATSWTVMLPDSTIEQYGANGRLLSVSQTDGAVYTLAYSAAGLLATIQNDFGRTVTLTYDGLNRLSTLVDTSGATTTYGYDSTSRLISVRYPDGRAVGYVYDHATWPFALTGILDSAGVRKVTYNYDSQGRVTNGQLAGGVGARTVAYPSASTAKLTDEAGAVWQQSLTTIHGQSQPSTESVSCAGCPAQSTHAQYNALGYLTLDTNRAGIPTWYNYNTRKLPITIVEAYQRPEARFTTIDWHPTLNLPRVITKEAYSAQPRVFSFQYDASGRKLSESVIAEGLTRTTSYNLNGHGQVTRIDGPRSDTNDTTAFTYDALGNLLTSTNAFGQTTTYSLYNALGVPGQVTLPNGTVLAMTYDSRGRMLSSTSAGKTTTYGYNVNGNLATVTSSDGATITYNYDQAGRLTGIDNRHGESIRYTLDSAGRAIRTDTFDNTGLLASTQSAVYNTMGQLVQAIDGSGRVTRYTYDANGNRTSVTDPLLARTQTVYDVLNRPILITDPLAGTVRLTYDPAGHVTNHVDPAGNSTQFTYSGFGETRVVVSPDSGSTSYTYDPAGNMLTKTDARGRTTTYVYDALQRLTRVTFADGQGLTETYDIAANGVGQLASMTDPSGTTSFTYDAKGRVATKTQVAQGVSLTLSYTRDSLGRSTSIQYPSGKVLGLTYANERATSLTWNGSPLITGIQYFPFGPVESWRFGGTVEYTRYIDRNSRVWKYLTPSGSRTLSFDNAGRVLHVADSSGLTQSFSHDANGRLLGFSGFTSAYSSESRTYSYDANGNRLTGLSAGVSSTYTYVPGTNRLQAVSGLYSNTYDPAGNLLSDGRLAHTYDARGRLVKTVVSGLGATTLTFKYDGLGQRISRWDSAANSGTVWIYDESGNVVGEYAYPGGAPVQELVWLGQTPVAVAGQLPISCATPPCTSYGIGHIWTDQLNTPRAITNAAGSLIWKWDSAPFGDTPANRNPSGLGQMTFNHRFPGQYLDVASGLVQNGARTYDPSIGRYVQSDPIGLHGGTNTYAYVRNNPTASIDPSGLYQLQGTSDGGTCLKAPACKSKAACKGSAQNAKYLSPWVCGAATIGVAGLVHWATRNPFAGAFAGYVTASACLSYSQYMHDQAIERCEACTGP